ncbi:hypothetical protein H5410_047528 [Solanum commersonii]|uniref:Zinc knuckle CX2CX4HX4C domain-containing protein n=1 Tax=Solanum commersonii TaxID=4109 RepID=A0A9J5XIX9_SOLCO|nr:hypothetical protein H5410_047528 [Solanum commersonii]
MATRNKTRPSCARVKVEVDLLRDFPKRIKIGMRRFNGEVMEKWVKIKYDYVPKYCKTCMIQGHDEQQCYGWVERSFENKVSTPGIQSSYINKDKGSNMHTPEKRTRSMETSSKVGVIFRSVEHDGTQAMGDTSQRHRTTVVESKENERLLVVNVDELPFKEAPNLIDESEEEIIHRMDREEEDALEYNIQQISKAEDLSPRHTNSLKAKRGRPTIPLQVKTRSSKERSSNSDQ